MREMKDSGVPWVGKMPKVWGSCKLKQITYMQSGDNITFSSISDDYEYPVYGGNGLRGYSNNYTHDGAYILVGRQGALCGNVHFVQKKFWASEHAVVVEPNNTCYVDWMYFVLQSMELGQYSESAAQPGLSVQRISNLRVPFPSNAIQKCIATYLDQKCDKIDATLERQRLVIEKLKEYKQSVITEAVTKGLDPNVPMKDSGVEWIGEIPEGWKIMCLRYVGNCQNGLSKSGEYFGRGYPFVSYGDVYKNEVLPAEVEGLVQTSDKERESCSVLEGDVFFTRTSETIEEVGLVSTCMNTIEKATFAGFLIRFRPYKDILYKGFSKYYFQNEKHRYFFVKEMNLVTRASLSQELLKRLPVLLPNQDEQKIIADYLDEKCSSINEAIGQKQSIIEKLTEYKKSLIYECVTGKVEV